MRIRKMLLISALMFGTAGLTACDNKAKETTPTAEAPDKKEKKDAKEGAASKGDAPKKDGEKKADAKADASANGLPFEATGPVAKVGDTEISAEAFNAEVEKLQRLTGGNLPPQMVQFYKKQLLYRVVDEHLLNKQVEGKKINVTDDEIEKEYNRFVERFPSKEQFEAYFQRTKMSKDELRADLGKRLRHEKLLVDKYGIKVEEKDVKDFYDKNIERFRQEEQVKASHILLKLKKDADDKTVKETEARAQALTKQAKAKGADFAALAKEHSEGPSGPRGGDLGFFPRKRMVKPFSDAAFKLKVGDVSEPVRTQFGFHVIKVVERQDAATKSFDETKDMIEYQLFSQKVRESMNKMLNELKEEAKVEYLEDNIKMNVKAPAKPMGIPGLGGHGGHGHSHAPGDGHDHGSKKPAPKINIPANGKLKLNAPKLNKDALKKQ